MKNLLIILLITGFLFSCKKNHVHEEENVWYTCSMDPQVMEKKPGTCPICKMDLTRTIIDPSDDKESIKLSDVQIKLGNIITQKAGEHSIYSGNSFRGTVKANEENQYTISSWVPGRIEKLAFKQTGELIKKEDFLYSIYSETLTQAAENYLMLREKQKQLGNEQLNFTPLIAAAKEKLVSFGLTESQIRNLSRSNIQAIPYFSSFTGHITDLSVNEGDYVSEGSEILKITNLSSVWVEAEMYEQTLTTNQTVTLEIEGKDQLLQGKVISILPEIRPNSRITIARILVDNKEEIFLKPGLRAVVFAGKNESKVFSVPTKAVLKDPSGDIVWIRSEGNVFKHRIVSTGRSDDEQTEIIKGIDPGEEVVTSGVYLLNSEYKLRNASSANLHLH